MSDLRVSLVQTSLHWENPTANLKMLDGKLAPLKGKADLVILPEMFTTGFSMNVENIAETMEGTAIQWMKAKSKYLETVLTGSLIIKENGNYYNRLIWMRPDGSFSQYDKRHLFTLAKEQLTFTAGTEKLIVELNGWKICPLICYDLRFPVFSRNVENYDLLIYTANFPAKRRKAWRSLLLARAIENQSYVLAVNLVGEDGNQFLYSGDSAVIDPYGEILREETDKEMIISAVLTKAPIDKIRKELPFLNDKDEFEITLNNSNS